MLKGCGKIILLLPLFSMATNAGEIKGVVRDSKTKDNIIGASVTIASDKLPQPVTVMSDDGTYRFPNLKAGTYTVSATFGDENIQSDPKTISDEQSLDVPLSISMTKAIASATTYKIETTGTRLPTTAAKAVSPITSIDSADIASQGSTRVEEVLNTLPQTSAATAQGAQVSNGSNGTATANLRGLGPQRTLVLIDGRRLGPGNPDSQLPVVGDLNFIPEPLIERIDVLTGGASAVYGADAVAGVVNFITKKNFEGVEFNLGWDFYQHSQHATDIQAIVAARNETNPSFVVPGNNWQPMGPSASLVMGLNSADGKGNITAYAAYRQDFGILQRDYDYSACALQGGDVFTCGGSSTSFPGRFDDDFGDNTLIPTGTVSTTPNIRGFFSDTDKYNYNPLNFFQRPDERWNLGALAHYKLADWAELYMQGSFLNDTTKAQIAPGGLFIGSPVTTNCGNPLLQRNPALWAEWCGSGAPSDVATTTLGNNTQGQLAGGYYGNPAAAYDPTQPIGPTNVPHFTTDAGLLDPAGGPDGIIVGRRNVEGGGRATFFTHNAFRHVFGLKGDFLSHWNYDVYHQYMSSDVENKTENYFNTDKFYNSLQVVNVGGTPTCVVADPTRTNPTSPVFDPSCVPYDLFNLAPGGNAVTGNPNVTEAMLNYIQTPGIILGRATERVVNGNVSGDLTAYGVRSPLACEGVALNAGGEYRYQTISFSPDSAFAAGKLSGTGGQTPSLETYFAVAEGFTEARIPLVQDLTAMKMLQVEGAYRYSNYSFNNPHSPANTLPADTQNRITHTFKVGGLWEFVDNMRVRGSFQRAVRSPSLAEMFSPSTVSLDGATDPCALKGSAPGGANPDLNDPAVLACVQAFPAFSAAQFANLAPSPAGQYNGQLGGRNYLQPEISNTIALGVFLQPSFIPGLQVSVDYFNISVDDTISLVGADFILRQCMNSTDAGGTGSTVSPVPGQTWCGLVHRDPGPSNLTKGSLWLTTNGYVTDHYEQLGNTRTDGIDFFVGYDLDTKTLFGSNWGHVYLAGNGTWLNRLTTQPLPSTVSTDTYDCAGLFGTICVGPSPVWRHKLRATWDTPIGLSVSAQWRFLTGVSLDAYSTNPLLTNTDNQEATDQFIAARNYLDVSATYALMDMFTFRFGVNNVLDQDPPLIGIDNNPIAGGGNGNTVPTVYDALGRHFYLNGTVKF